MNIDSFQLYVLATCAVIQFIFGSKQSAVRFVSKQISFFDEKEKNILEVYIQERWMIFLTYLALSFWIVPLLVLWSAQGFWYSLLICIVLNRICDFLGSNLPLLPKTFYLQRFAKSVLAKAHKGPIITKNGRIDFDINSRALLAIGNAKDDL